MHTSPLGVLAWFLGSELWELIVDGPFWGNVNDRLNFVWGQIQMEYDLQNLGNRLGQLTFFNVLPWQFQLHLFNSES